MKKFFIFLGIICLIGGVICTGIGVSHGASLDVHLLIGMDRENYDPNNRQVEYYDATEFAIEANLQNCAFILEYDQDITGVAVSLPKDHINNFTVEHDTEHSKLAVNQKEKFNFSYNFWDRLAGRKDIRFVLIKIGSDVENVDLKTNITVGSVFIEHGVYDDIDVKTTTGAVLLGKESDKENQKVIANSVNAKATTGAVVVTYAEVSGSFIAITTTGAVVIDKDLVAESVYAETTTGAVSVASVTSKSVKLKTTTGAVTARNIKNADLIEANVTTGGIHLEVAGILAEYTVKIKGSVVNNGTTDKMLTANSTTGGIHYEFKNH